MSTAYGLKCKCGALSADNFNQEVCREVLLLWPAIKEVYGNLGWIEIQIYQDYDEPRMLDYLKEHYAHGVSIVSEYGDEVN